VRLRNAVPTAHSGDVDLAQRLRACPDVGDRGPHMPYVADRPRSFEPLGEQPGRSEPLLYDRGQHRVGEARIGLPGAHIDSRARRVGRSNPLTYD
jgi:hypothetical protein